MRHELSFGHRCERSAGRHVWGSRWAYRGGIALTIAWVVLGGGVTGAEPAGGTPPAGATTAAVRLSAEEQAAFARDVAPLLKKYCVDCHSGDEPKGEFRLDSEAGALVADVAHIDRLISNLEMRIMPPEDAPQPTPAEVAVMARWFQTALAEHSDPGHPQPGRVTLRRLNRTEYNLTIRDLVGVDFQPADDFPSDDIGYGFDNIGDVLSLPPILLEKYLAAAEQVVEQAVLDTSSLPPPRARYQAEYLRNYVDRQPLGPAKVRQGVAKLLTGGNELGTIFESPAAGPYVLRVRGHGEQAGEELVKMAVRVDGIDVAQFEVLAVAGETGTYEARTELAAGPRRISIAFLNDYYNPEAVDPAARDRNLCVESLEIDGPLDPALRPLPESHRRIVFREPSGTDAAEHAACAREVLQAFASRAFRRPVTEEELGRLVALVEMAEKEGDTFVRGIQLALEAVLVSPHFLFRVELDPTERSTEPRQLNDYELASRLSYFLWSSMPDETLFGLAATGQLRDPVVMAAQVRRMLADPKARALAEHFGGQWLTVRNLRNFAPDLKQFPKFNEALRAAMLEETTQFFLAVMTEDRSVFDFLDGDFTFVNEDLARLYGVEGVRGSEFRRVSLASLPRRGVLTQASVLAVTSNPTRTSPVKRGKWVMEQILGTPPPPPPPGTPDLDQAMGVPADATLRARIEAHRAKPECASCHDRMDPLGFGFENFDAIGAWREQDLGQPVDASGTLPDGSTFRGPLELVTILRSRPDDFRRALAEKLLTYALGRGVEVTDRRTVQQICQELEGAEDRFSALVLAIVRSEPFQLRGAEP